MKSKIHNKNQSNANLRQNNPIKDKHAITNAKRKLTGYSY